MHTSMNIHDVNAVTAELNTQYVDGLGKRSWVTIKARSDSGSASFTLFCTTERLAAELALAIASANVKIGEPA